MNKEITDEEKALYNKIYGRLTKVDVEELNAFVEDGLLVGSFYEALQDISKYGLSTPADGNFMQGYAAALSVLYQFEGCASTVVMEVFKCNRIRVEDFDKYHIDQLDRKFLTELNNQK